MAARAVARAIAAAINITHQQRSWTANLVDGSFLRKYMTILDIVNAVKAPYTVWRTLHGVEPLCRNGRPIFISGNASVLFKVWHEGRLKMLKCYTRQHPYLKEIYGSDFLPREVYVTSLLGSQWVDCLLYDYIEGKTLDERLCEASQAGDYAPLAAGFDRMANRLLAVERKHGDLNCENIIVDSDNQFHPIDFDAAFVPSLAGRPSVEVGTTAYQHPARNEKLFDQHIDDYSIAFLSTLLNAAVFDPSLFENFSSTHTPAILPHEIVTGHCDRLDTIIDQFARRGDAVHYRIARMLTSQWPRLFNLKSTIAYSDSESLADSSEDDSLEQESGLWGCRNSLGWVVAPLYDDGFDPTEGYMVVSLGGYTHLISMESRRVVHSFEKGTTAKPVKDGQLSIRLQDGSRQSISLDALLQNSSE